MPQPVRNTLRAAVRVLLCTIVMLVALGARTSLHVCTGSCCGERTAAAPARHEAADGCCRSGCCRAGGRAAVPANGERRGSHQAQAQYDDCCVDLCLEVEPAPLPHRVAVDAMPEIASVAMLPPLAPTVALPVQPPESGAPATGPPRRDRRTLLLSTTVLRL